MEDWELDTEECSSEILHVPIFNFQLNHISQRIIADINEESIPSDDEAIHDISILEFPTFDVQKETISTPIYTDISSIYDYALHMLVYRGDINSIYDMWQNSNDEYNECINIIDMRGNTPLMLAVKLITNGKDYEKAFKFLLFHDASINIKDAKG